MNNIMIDMETLSTRSDAAILTIGAVAFDLDSGKISDKTLHLGLAMQETVSDPVIMNIKTEYGHIDPSTVKWWLQQSTSARQQLIEKTDENLDLFSALTELSLYIEQFKIEIDRDIKVWSHGTSFDLTILRNAYRRIESDAPWKYWNERDTRTFNELSIKLLNFDANDIPRQNTKHNALDDARYQAQQMIVIYQLIREGFNETGTEIKS